MNLKEYGSDILGKTVEFNSSMGQGRGVVTQMDVTYCLKLKKNGAKESTKVVFYYVRPNGSTKKRLVMDEACIVNIGD